MGLWKCRQSIEIYVSMGGLVKLWEGCSPPKPKGSAIPDIGIFDQAKFTVE